MQFHIPLEIAENYFGVSTKLPNNLAARATGRRELVGVGDDCDGVETSLAFGESLEDGHSFGAHGQAIAGVFHIATGIDAAGLRAYRGAHPKLREGRNRVFPSASRRSEQDFPVASCGHVLASDLPDSAAMSGITARSKATN